MEFYGALGDIELAGDFLVGKILEERIKNFLFAAAEIGDGIGLEAARLVGENRIHESGKNLTRNPEAAIGDERQSSNELLAGFLVSENSLNSQAQKRKTVGVLVLVADDDEARVGETLDQIRQESASRLTRSMRIDDINLGFGRFEIAKVGSERRFELLGDDLELGLV